jgi:acetyltransferase-like isoleucine patch superfamily enzyme
MKPIKAYIKLAWFRAKWRKKNLQNETVPNIIFPMDKVTVGKYTYGLLNIFSYRNTQERLSIGNFCSIAHGVQFLLSGEHSYNTLLTFPLDEKWGNRTSALCKGPIIVEDDVWIGVGVIVLSGVIIGKGSVIAAGSIVSKDIPPYSIFIGNEIVKKRFSEEIIKKLSVFNLLDITFQHFQTNKDLLLNKIDENSVIKLEQNIFK